MSTIKVTNLQHESATSANIILTSTGLVGVNTTTPDNRLHVFAGDSSGSSHASAQLTIENSGNSALQFLAGTSSSSEIRFGDSGDNGAGSIAYVHSDNSLRFGTTNGVEDVRIDSSGRLLIGTTSARSGLGPDISPLGQIEATSYTQSALSVINNQNSTAPAFVILGKSRGTSVGSNDIVSSGDRVGEIRFVAADGSDLNGRPGSISCEIDGTPGNNDLPGRLVFETTADGSSSPTERMRIDSSGRMLIGTSTQGTGDSKLLVSGANPNLRIESSSYPNGFSELHFTAPANNGLTTPVRTKIRFAHDEGDGGWSGSLRFFVGGFGDTERMRITNGGDFYFNTTVSTKTTDGFRVENGGIPNVARGTSGTFMQFFHSGSGSQIGSITNNGGTATAYNTSSDYRLKENITAVADGITRLQQLKPSRFNFIADPDKTVDGFIAHEVQDVIPEAINGEKDAVDANGDPIYQGIDQSKLVPLLTAALQEAIAKIETLETQNATQASAIEALTARLDAAGL